MTRHGVIDLDKLSIEERALVEKHPPEKHQELLDYYRVARDTQYWAGDDWPRPRPGGNPRSVAIVGFGKSRLVAPFGRKGWELWGLNDPSDIPGIPARHAFTRWFQIHPPHYLGKHYPKGLDDLAYHWGSSTGVRLYMDRHYPEYPDSEAYPREAVEALTSFGWYHASSFDWMVALAILEGFEEIAIYGCEFYMWPIMNGEPASALQALHYWIGVAEGRGIKVTVMNGGHLFQTIHIAAYESRLRYGWDREPALDLGTDAPNEDGQWSDVR